MTSPSRIRALQLDEAVDSLLADLEAALVKRANARSAAGMAKIESPVVTREKHEATIERLTAKIEAAEKAETKVRYFRRDAQSPPAADVIDEATERALIEDDQQWERDIAAAIPDESKRAYSTGVRHGFKHGHPQWRALRRQQQARFDANEAWLRMIRGADDLVARPGGVRSLFGPAPIDPVATAAAITRAGRIRRGEEPPDLPPPQTAPEPISDPKALAERIVAAGKRARGAETRGPGGSFWKSRS